MSEIKEEFRPVKGYEGLYEISSSGKIRGLKRNKILSCKKSSNRYLRISLCKNNKESSYSVHQLVAIAFLNHVPCGMDIVVDHINSNKLDNRVENLQLITSRENTSRNRKGTSKYTGVHWLKAISKWRAVIGIKDKKKHLGVFTNEYEAHLAYQSALKEINTI